MNGAESLVHTARAAGVEVCFANPGTTELALMTALDSAGGLRGILGLFEGVCTGAADGYGRMAGKPALALLHLGPGLANGLANLHNARRAHSPVVVLIGDNSDGHAALDPPLNSEIAALAAPMSGWVRRTAAPGELARDLAEAIAAAQHPPGQVASLIVPADCQWATAEGPAAPLVPPALPPVDEKAVTAVVEALRAGEPAVLLLGRPALGASGLRAAGRIAARTGCRLVCETHPARVERGAPLPVLERLPYFPEAALQSLAGTRHLLLAGARAPVSFFDWPETGGRLVPEGTAVHSLASPLEDAAGALEAVADSLGAGGGPAGAAQGARPAEPAGPLSPETLGAAVAFAQPEGAIVVDEAATSGRPYWGLSAGCPPHTLLALTGGSIGQGLPCATGAAVACPDRPVIALQADGSGLYTLQALWTQAREGLNVTTVLCSNRCYRILRMELARAGVRAPGPAAAGLTDLAHPEIDWVRLAGGFGVPASRVETAQALAQELARAVAEPGPHLIEALLGGPAA